MYWISAVSIMADGEPPALSDQAARDARRYMGEELDLFVAAHAWRRYWAAQVAPSLGRQVLEVGAGLGSTTLALWHAGIERWTAVEPDPDLAGRLEGRLATLGPPRPEVHRGTLASLPSGAPYDTAVYIDVLEHLPDDAQEVARAAARLAPGGRLIALSPAHPWLFSPFDLAIGHLRRYTRRSFAAMIGRSLVVERAFHLDAGGALLSLGNRLLLRRRGPSAGQIAFWNRVAVPLSRLADPLLLRRLGRSVVVIARKPP